MRHNNVLSHWAIHMWNDENFDEKIGNYRKVINWLKYFDIEKMWKNNEKIENCRKNHKFIEIFCYWENVKNKKC